MISEYPSAIGANGMAPAPSPAASQHVEVIGTHLRIAADVQLGGFRRLSDYVSLQSGSLTLRGVTLLNRRGMATADQLAELTIRQEDLTLIAQRIAPPPELEPISDDVRVDKIRRRILAVTTGHVVEGTVSLYPGADLIAFLQATDPPFLPLVDVRVRWLADRRLKTTYEFVLLNRSHVVAVTGLD
jgi:hypothetical protein